MDTPKLGSDEWHALRRELITGTDIPIILGVSPFTSEAELAAVKLGELPPAEENARMRIGRALEEPVAREYALATGRKLRRVNRIAISDEYPWAGASLDRVVGGRERRIVEVKTSAGRAWEDGLPQYVEAQVRWQMGVAGYERADVAAWLFGGREPLHVFELTHDESVWRSMIDIALDFRRRLAAGGPFTADRDFLAKRYPADDGTAITAWGETVDTVKQLIVIRGERRALGAQEEVLEAKIKQAMGEAATLLGPGWRVTWKQAKPTERTDWRAVATPLLSKLDAARRAELITSNTTVVDGQRPFRVWMDKEDTGD